MKGGLKIPFIVYIKYKIIIKLNFNINFSSRIFKKYKCRQIKNKKILITVIEDSNFPSIYKYIYNIIRIKSVLNFAVF